MDKDIEQYLIKFSRERDTALLSLDKTNIINFMKKYNIPYSNSEKVFWTSVHKVIPELNNATNEQKENSIKWLAANGFKTFNGNSTN